MKIRTLLVEDIDGQSCEMCVGDDIWDALEKANVLDAEVIGLPCKACGGSGERQAEVFWEGCQEDRPPGVIWHHGEPCPDCPLLRR